VYESFYKLSNKPFRLSPDPQFFFPSSGHKRALSYLLYGLNQGEGFVVITGAPGTGKTTLAHKLLSQIDPGSQLVSHLASTQIEAEDLLRLVAASFKLRSENISKAGLLKDIESFLIARARERKRCLLVVDEAQNLPERSIEELRMLSNFQVGSHALLQIFVLGQEQFRAMLDGPQFEQLRQRVIANYHLNPLNRDETQQYIEARLQQVGWRGDPLFEASAFDGIFAYTGGIPRRINMFCDRLLLYGYLEGLHILAADAVASVVAELRNDVVTARNDRLVFTPVERQSDGTRELRRDSTAAAPLSNRESAPNKNEPRPVAFPGRMAAARAPALVSEPETGRQIAAKERPRIMPVVAADAVTASREPLRKSAEVPEPTAINSSSTLRKSSVESIADTKESQRNPGNTLRAYRETRDLPAQISETHADEFADDAEQQPETSQRWKTYLVLLALGVASAMWAYSELVPRGNDRPAVIPKQRETNSTRSAQRPMDPQQESRASSSADVAAFPGESTDTPPYRMPSPSTSEHSAAAAESTSILETPYYNEQPEVAAASTDRANSALESATPNKPVESSRKGMVQPSSAQSRVAEKTTSPSVKPDRSKTDVTAIAKSQPTPESRNIGDKHESAESQESPPENQANRIPDLTSEAPAIAAPVPSSAPESKPVEPAVVAMASPQPAPVEPAITEDELKLLLAKFSRYYNDGDLTGFLSLFDPKVKTEDQRELAGLRADYAELFTTTTARQIAFNDLRWDVSDHFAFGNGKFEVLVRAGAENRPQVLKGSITITVEKKNSDLLIVKFLHALQQ
jgi:putative secretion ATPase (PEP-CTERM system associated)